MTSEPEKKEERIRSPAKAFWLFIAKTLVIIAALYVIGEYVLTPQRITGNGMSPFVRDGDLGIFYQLEKPRTGEVVLYKDSDGKVKPGRIAAVGGQEVDFPEEGGYTVDGYAPNEEITYETHPANDGPTYPLTVPEEEYFILNDFRQMTDDSRQEGCIKKSQIIGTLELLFRRRDF